MPEIDPQRFFRLLCISLLSLCLPVPELQASSVQQEINNSLDSSKALQPQQQGQFVAVPIPISNPTIGTGLQGALLYLHDKPDSEQSSPNATSGLGVMYTDTDSWLSAIFHDNYLLQDRLRVRAALGTGKVNLDYYGFGSQPVFADNPIPYSVESDIALFKLLGRLPATNHWYAGVRAICLGTDISFDVDNIVPGIPSIESELDLVSLSALLNFDSRDDNYYPASGQFFELAIAGDDEDWHSDADYNRYSIDYSYYLPLSNRRVLALRLQAEQVEGDTPFFLLPRLNMRGFSSNLYQDEAVASGHLEWREKFTERWGYMLSLEAGAVGSTLSSLDEDNHIVSVGAGLRWQVDAEKKLHLGLDIGVSEEDTATYIHVGEAF